MARGAARALPGYTGGLQGEDRLAGEEGRTEVRHERAHAGTPLMDCADTAEPAAAAARSANSPASILAECSRVARESCGACCAQSITEWGTG